MDTQTALNTLTALQTGNNALIAGYQAQNQALQVAIDQLNGILNTPSADLTEAKTALATAQQAQTDLQSQLDTASATLAANRMTPPDTITEATAA